jgi:hypothetical protein
VSQSGTGILPKLNFGGVAACLGYRNIVLLACRRLPKT